MTIGRTIQTHGPAPGQVPAPTRPQLPHHLIELGGLVGQADLVELLNDDHATLLGAFLDLAGQLRGTGDTDPAHLRARWRQAGLRAFEADRDADTA